MANFERPFVKAVFKNTGGFLPTWPLGRQIKLGDIVALRFRRMDFLGNLSDPDINIQVMPGQDITGDDLRWQSKNAINISLKIAGQAPALGSVLTQAEAGITIGFTKGGGFLFEPKGLKFNRIENLVSVRNQVIEKLSSRMFRTSRIYIVKEVATVDSYALTISQSSNSKLEVSAGTGINSISTKDLADLTLDLKVLREDQLDFNSIGKTGGAIFFKGEKLKLKSTKRDDLMKSFPNLIHDPDEVLLSKVDMKGINSKNAKTFFDMVDVSSDDIDQLLGEEEI